MHLIHITKSSLNNHEDPQSRHPPIQNIPQQPFPASPTLSLCVVGYGFYSACPTTVRRVGSPCASVGISLPPRSDALTPGSLRVARPPTQNHPASYQISIDSGKKPKHNRMFYNTLRNPVSIEHHIMFPTLYI